MNEGFTVHEHNPNDRFGGGACLVSGGKASEDCAGKWINFPTVSTEYHASPFATICEKHLAMVVAKYKDDEVQTDGDPLPLRKAVPITREDTGLPDFVGVAGIPLEI